MHDQAERRKGEDDDHCVPILRSASTLFVTTLCGPRRSCEKSGSTNFETIDEFDG